MTFIFQQPGTARHLEAIDAASIGADSGGGVFAFATRDGINTFFTSPNIAGMLARGTPFRLIVGVDAITNADALLCLGEKLTEFPNSLTVNVFYHEYPNSTFHPKFTWFQEGDGLRLVTGSGNLTLRGLGKNDPNNLPPGNWEAFSVQTLRGADATGADQEIDRWLDTQQRLGALRSLDDPDVLKRAVANARMRVRNGPGRPRRPAAGGAVRGDVVPDINVQLDTPEILLRELSKNRDGQADVGQKALKNFFGFTGTPKKIFVQHVSRTNELGPVLEKNMFVNKSKNYRLELQASANAGRIRHDDSRMILVASRFDRSTYRYTIVPVTADDYDDVASLLGPIPRGRHKMRETRMTPEQLREAWKGVPTNMLPTEQIIPEP